MSTFSGKSFFQRVKDSIDDSSCHVCCFEGVDAIQTVRTLAGPTNGRLAAPGTITWGLQHELSEKI